MLDCTAHRRAEHAPTGAAGAHISHDHADSLPGDPSMQHLRLVGVHEDGLHLLLADDEGNRFTVPLDEALRAAARRDREHPELALVVEDHLGMPRGWLRALRSLRLRSPGM